MVFALLTALLGIAVAGMYVGGTDLVERAPWIPAFGAWWALGLDGMGLVMVLLTVVLVPLVLLAEWKRRWPRAAGAAQAYVGLVLALESLSLFVFMAERRPAVLPVLRGHPDPDVLPHRRLRRRTALLRGGQVPAVQPRRRTGHAGLGDRLVRGVGAGQRHADLPAQRAGDHAAEPGRRALADGRASCSPSS